MRQYLLMAIAGLLALIMGLFTIPYQGTDYRGQVIGNRDESVCSTNQHHCGDTHRDARSCVSTPDGAYG